MWRAGGCNGSIPTALHPRLCAHCLAPAQPSLTLDAAAQAMGSEDGVGNKWVNQSTQGTGSITPVSVRGRSPMPLACAALNSIQIAAEYKHFTSQTAFGFTCSRWQMSADPIMLVTKCRASLVRNSCEVVHQTLAPAQLQQNKSPAPARCLHWAGSLRTSKEASARWKSPTEHAKYLI